MALIPWLILHNCSSWLHYTVVPPLMSITSILNYDCISQIIHDYVMSHMTVACQLIAVLAWVMNPKRVHGHNHLLPWTCASRPSSTALTTIPSPLPSTDKPDNILIPASRWVLQFKIKYDSRISFFSFKNFNFDSIWSRHMTLHLLRTLLPNQINTSKEITAATNKSKVLK